MASSTTRTSRWPRSRATRTACAGSSTTSRSSPRRSGPGCSSASARSTSTPSSTPASPGYTGRCRALSIELTHRVAPVRVVGDPERLAQVVDNLLSNALRYTDPGGTIDVALELCDGRAVIEVADSGIGIAAGELDRVFDRFWRSPGRAGADGRRLGRRARASSPTSSARTTGASRSPVSRAAGPRSRSPCRSRRASRWPSGARRRPPSRSAGAAAARPAQRSRTPPRSSSPRRLAAPGSARLRCNPRFAGNRLFRRLRVMHDSAVTAPGLCRPRRLQRFFIEVRVDFYTERGDGPQAASAGCAR